MLEAGPKPESFESLKAKVETLAIALSHKLLLLPKDDLSWQSESPNLAHVFSSNEPGGKTGVQRIFEERMASIESENDDSLRRSRLFNFIQELEKLNGLADIVLAGRQG